MSYVSDAQRHAVLRVWGPDVDPTSLPEDCLPVPQDIDDLMVEITDHLTGGAT